ncbi:hypothetical protein VOLCADRAFT_98990 [Volvox carteri f. nagariensis]|uniref:Uncharacterized protein n=1 Tax=Volvox carteri f. nagariensis TaxID=3068 RepID=D8UGS1_VOLCA|nr:uncharacterized protein VOLCADRAFT_98990 [Volvox carteri f. nagariensis]EFJ41100.1 hypothetical protein VOLCADRAFT_98990 [Volvox carteri f. nagariensis]|eukprot:XP_002957863.1 hypothetical protein VOLCADRAFT_98990 [Volvox carteri f. nagariensis]
MSDRGMRGLHQTPQKRCSFPVSESDTSGLKRSRSADGGSIRSFLANTIQIGVFLKNLALFFYTTNTALHLIENHYLVTACAAVGITLPGRKKLATTTDASAFPGGRGGFDGPAPLSDIFV